MHIWIDQLNVSVSDRWDRVTEEALKDCGAFIIILSPTSVSSENVLDEISYALEEKKQIFPVLYQQCKIPFRIRRIQRSDFTKDYENGLKELFSAIELQVEKKQSKQVERAEDKNIKITNFNEKMIGIKKTIKEKSSQTVENKYEQEAIANPRNILPNIAHKMQRKSKNILKPLWLVLMIILVILIGYHILELSFSEAELDNSSGKTDEPAQTTDHQPVYRQKEGKTLQDQGELRDDHIIKNEDNTSTSTSTNKNFDVKLVLPSKMNDADIFVDNEPAIIVSRTPTIITIRLKQKKSNHQIVVKSGGQVCKKELLAFQDGLRIQPCQ